MFFKANIPKKIWQSAHGGINRIQFQNNPEACLKDNYTALGSVILSQQHLLTTLLKASLPQVN